MRVQNGNRTVLDRPEVCPAVPHTARCQRSAHTAGCKRPSSTHCRLPACWPSARLSGPTPLAPADHSDTSSTAQGG
jgi:hypothetical protein